MENQTPEVEVQVNPTEQAVELTPEQKAAKALEDKMKAEKLEQQREFFKLIRAGGMFLKIIFKDLEQYSMDSMNRSARRRYMKELRKGVLSKELIQSYLDRTDEILKQVNAELNPAPKVEVDGADFLAQAKQLEAEGKLNADGSLKDTTNGVAK